MYIHSLVRNELWLAIYQIDLLYNNIKCSRALRHDMAAPLLGEWSNSLDGVLFCSLRVCFIFKFTVWTLSDDEDALELLLLVRCYTLLDSQCAKNKSLVPPVAVNAKQLNWRYNTGH